MVIRLARRQRLNQIKQMIAAELCADATLAGEWPAAGDYAWQLVTAEATEASRVELTL